MRSKKFTPFLLLLRQFALVLIETSLEKQNTTVSKIYFSNIAGGHFYGYLFCYSVQPDGCGQNRSSDHGR